MPITGFEPTASVITGQCLNQCATEVNIYIYIYMYVCVVSGEKGPLNIHVISITVLARYVTCSLNICMWRRTFVSTLKQDRYEYNIYIGDL